MAQTIKSEVSAMFPPNTRDLWINHYQGYFDQKYDADLYLGTDGNQCHAICVLKSSGTKLYLEGINTKKHLNLIEYKPYNGVATGFLSGEFDGVTYSGIWRNKDKNIYFPFRWKLNINQADLPLANYSTAKWVRKYEGKLNGTNLKLSIEKNNEIFTYILQENGIKKKDAIVDTSKSVVLLLLKANGMLLDQKYAVIDTSDLSKINIIKLDEEEEVVITTLKSSEVLNYIDYNYADLLTMIEVEKPSLGKQKFDDWLDISIKSWIQSNTKDTKTLTSHDVGASDRWKDVGYAWVEVDYFDKELISGTIYLQSSKSKKTSKQSFIYDLDRNKPIKIADLFEDARDTKTYFKQVIAAKKKEKSWDTECKKWVAEDNFDFVTVRSNGLRFHTNFNSLYGEREIIIPFSELTTKYKLKNILKNVDQ